MVLPPRRPSAEMRSIRRELQRRRPKPLAPLKPAAAKKPSAPPHGGTSDKVRDPRQEFPPSTTHAQPPPPPRRPQPSSTASAPPSPQSGSVSVSASHARAATPDAGEHLKPGAAVLVRTRTQMVIDGKTLVLWLAATVVSSATDGGYEVVYEGNLPRRENPLSTVRVPLHHVRPRLVKLSPPTSQPPSTAARPTTAGKSLRLLPKLESEMQAAPRPTTAGKSIHVVRKILSEMEFQARTMLPGY